MNFYDIQMMPRLPRPTWPPLPPYANAPARKQEILYLPPKNICVCKSIKVMKCRARTTIKCWLDADWVTAMEFDWPRPERHFAVVRIFHLPAAHHQFAMTVTPPKGPVSGAGRELGTSFCVPPVQINEIRNRCSNELLLACGRHSPHNRTSHLRCIK